MRKPTRKGLVRSNDKLWSQIIRSIGTCEICGNTETLQAHHWHTGKKAGGYGVRWLLDDGVCVCAKHHFEAHQSGGAFMQLLQTSWGRDAILLKSIRVHARKINVEKFTLNDLQRINNELRLELENLEKSA